MAQSDSRGPVTLVKQFFLRVCELSNILKNPCLQLRLELTNFDIIPNSIWEAVPLGRGPKAVTVHCKGEVGVGDDDLVCPIIPVHDVQVPDFA